ncbi:hypothetical protein [Variovorax paradoxus]|uniref:hypothetical protein n=1 Tax=Variovorax paradoxus TaxID=34073 RepID=UPI003ECD6470
MDDLSVDYVTANLADPDTIIRELFDPNKEIQEHFQRDFSDQIKAFADALAPAFERYEVLQKLAVDERRAMVVNFVFGVLDSVVVSTKLLLAGNVIPSGNLMRQAIEGICVAILCSEQEQVVVDRKRRGKKIVSETKLTYWMAVRDGDKRAFSHHALTQLSINAKNLDVQSQAVARLKRGQQFYHQFSHPNLLGSAFRMDFGKQGMVFVGGSYDPKKHIAYQHEFEQRTDFSAVLPSAIEVLIHRCRIT